MPTLTVGAGRDHSSLQAAINAIKAATPDLTGLGIHLIDVYDAVTLTAALDWSGLKTTINDHVIIRAKSAYLLLTSTDEVRLADSLNAGAYNKMIGFKIDCNSPTTRYSFVVADYKTQFISCWITNSQGNARRGAKAANNAHLEPFIDCIVQGFTAEYGMQADNCSPLRCTLYGNYRGLIKGGGAARDCISLNNTNKDYAMFSGSSLENCVSSDATAVGINPTINAVASNIYVDAANGDFTPVANNPFATYASDGGQSGARLYVPTASGIISKVGVNNSITEGEQNVAISAVGVKANSTTQTVTLFNSARSVNCTVVNWNNGSPIVNIPARLNFKYESSLDLSITDDDGTTTFRGVTLSTPANMTSSGLAAVPAASAVAIANAAADDFSITPEVADSFAFETQAALAVDSSSVVTINPAQNMTIVYRYWDESASTYLDGTYQVSVGGSNTAPVITSATSVNVVSGQTATYTPTATDANGDTLQYTISNNPLYISQLNSTVNIDASNLSAGTSATFDLNVSDGTLTTTQLITVNVVSNTTNAPPTINGLNAAGTAQESTTQTQTFTVSSLESGTVTLSDSTYASLSSSNGIYTLTVNLPSYATAQQITFDVIANDGVNAAVTETITYNVTQAVITPAQVGVRFKLKRPNGQPVASEQLTALFIDGSSITSSTITTSAQGFVEMTNTPASALGETLRLALIKDGATINDDEMLIRRVRSVDLNNAAARSDA